MGSASSCGSVLPAPYKGITDVCTRVFREGGVRGLYRGVCKYNLTLTWSSFSATLVLFLMDDGV
jgi:hypothetical protein